LAKEPTYLTILNKEPSTGDIAYGAQSSFTFDIGGTYGLTVTAQAVTISQEDVAALIGSLDVASVAEGAKVVAKIVIAKGMSLGRLVGGVFKSLDSSDPSSLVDVSTDTKTYSLTTTTDPLGFLDGLKILPDSSNYKSSSANPYVTVQANVSAFKLDKTGTYVPMASVDKSIQISFTPVADGVTTYSLNDTALVGNEDEAISLHSLFFSTPGATTPLAITPDASETLTYVLKGLPNGSRLVDISSFSGLTGDKLSSAISNASTIGRVLGEGIELTKAEADVAGLVMGANASSASKAIQLYAYTQEPGTASVSDLKAPTGSISVAFNPVADKAFLSMDSQARALVNTGSLSVDLLAKSKIEIPATVALTDTDGSESLWVRITPTTVSGAPVSTLNFTFSGVLSSDSYTKTNDFYLVKASELANVRVSSSQAFTGEFHIEALSIEGAPSTATAAINAINLHSSNANDTLVASVSQDLAVQFLMPATTPNVSFIETPNLVQEAGKYSLEFSFNLTAATDDKVTVLMTGIPSNGANHAKFYKHLVVNGVAQDIAIGAPAEVSGVWVFNSSDLKDGASAATIRMVLPKGYTPKATDTFDVTAYAVDSLGLTNAKSSALTSNKLLTLVPNPVPTDAVDPVIIDVAGDGLALTDASTRVSFDINGDNVPDNVGWTKGGNDAFLVLRPTVGGSLSPIVNGKSLVTENLVAPETTDAIADLKTFDADNDGWVSFSELQAKGYTPQLWFDKTAPGIATDNEIGTLSKDFAINVASYNDTMSTDPGGAVIAGSIAAGGLRGSYTLGATTASLSAAKTFDVFLPISSNTSSANSTATPVTISGTEDSPDGVDISSSLTSADWQSAFGLAWTDGIAKGANVLLMVRAKEAGTTFNLSQGARLETEPTDTWLLNWDPKSEKTDLKLFTDENFSGTLNLEMRATVVYTDAKGPQQFTVARGLGLNIAAVSDRLDLSVPESLPTVAETDLLAGQNITLGGLKMMARDGSESVSMELTPTTNLPAGSYFIYKDSTIINAVNGKFTVSGPIASNDLQFHLPAYASGTFGFLVSAKSQDGTANPYIIDKVPLTLTVTPVAQAPDVTLKVDQTSVSESVRSFGVTAIASPKDKDGSEEVSNIKLVVSNPDLTIGSTFVVGAGASSTTYYFQQSKDNNNNVISGKFELNLPKSYLTPVIGSINQTITGKITTPAYFDGTLSVQAFASTVEKADISQVATGSSALNSVTVVPVTDGLATFETKGLSVVAGDPIVLSKLVTSLNKLDADESLNLTIGNIPLGSNLSANGQAVQITNGRATIQEATLAKLANYVLTTSDKQESFSLTIAATSQDGNADPLTVSKSVNISSNAQYDPVLVKADGTALPNGVLSASFNEDSSGILNVGVSVGNKLNPTNVKMTLSGVPAGLKVFSVANNSELIKTSTDSSTGQGSYVFQADQLSQGLRFNVVPGLGLENFAGKLELQLRSEIQYGGGDPKVATAYPSLLIQSGA